MNSNKADAFLPVVGVAGLLAIWSLVTWRQWVDPVLLPSPIATFDSLWRGMEGRSASIFSRPSTARRPRS